MLNFSCVKPIKTVYSVLEEHDALDMLSDDLIAIATKEIYSEGRPRREVQREIKSKERVSCGRERDYRALDIFDKMNEG